ncbi:mitochondrial Rho GTPase 1 isoform X2 [Lepeophtheirus salmonis]|uniref:mitochondrial Rho GTPase 1 isoform X2 n=1 Tax=Lepeophtheirus salmonis TaxID=72036 RepID=UPI001AEA581F|nr:mitochondrial Rho GTPase 1-like isoform X1 [Lepeophtheirus salmonis]
MRESKGKRDEVRILLIGDRDVGKTSLILSLVSEEFPPEVPGRAEDITIPGDLTPEKIPTLIADYNALEQNEEALSEELLRADVICIVYAVDDLESLESVSDHWIPLIRRTLESQKTPLILVGNKVDLSEYSTMEAVLQMMNEYEEIETCVECSAKNLKNISEMFYFAQKAVLHPSAPLFDHQKKDLTTACKRALTRVFMLCDEDNDALLSDEEINKFQRRCFGLDLEPGILENLKSVVHKNCPEGLSKMTGQLTLSGFLALHGLFIQKGRNETTWTMLRKFGYDEDLTLSRDYLYPSFSAPSNSIIELSNIGYDFLTFIFEKYDKDSDKAMSPQEIIDLFSTCPVTPWGPDLYNTVVTNEKGYLSYHGYLALWTFMTFVDTKKTIEYLGYLGYTYSANSGHEENQISAFSITKDKKVDVGKKPTPRNIYRCNIIGPKGAGKTTFCQGLLGRSIDDIKNIPSYEIPKHTINSIQVYGQEKYLILEDVDVLNVSSPSIPSESNCDVCCLVYDASDPRSFEFVAAVFLKYYVDSKVPVLIVANKSDLPSVRQDYILQPEAFCAKHKLPPPQPYNTKGRVKTDMYVKLATMAAFPNLRRLVHAMIMKSSPREWIGSFRYLTTHFNQMGLVAQDTGLLTFGIGIAIAIVTGAVVIKMVRSYT